MVHRRLMFPPLSNALYHYPTHSMSGGAFTPLAVDRASLGFFIEGEREMCLHIIWTDEETEEWLAGQPSLITAGKIVEKEEDAFSAPWRTWTYGKYPSGCTQAKLEKICTGDVLYWSGFHFYANGDKAACEYIPGSGENRILITCLVKKEWITAVGKNGTGLISFVASQAIFPHYPETEARHEDLPKEETAVLTKNIRGVIEK